MALVAVVGRDNSTLSLQKRRSVRSSLRWGRRYCLDIPVVGQSPSCRPTTRNLRTTRQKFGKLYNRVNSMPDLKELDEHYRSLSDKELARRNLTSDDAKRHFAPDWLDKADVGAVGVFKLEGGERVTAEVVGLNE